MEHSAEYWALQRVYTRVDDELTAFETHDRHFFAEQQRLREHLYMDLDTGPLTDDAA
jgi:hypothetical protein